MNDGEFDELNKEAQKEKKSIRDQEIGSLYGAYKNNHNQKDIDAIKNREGKNEGINHQKDDEEESTTLENKTSSLEEKEGLKDKKEEKENNSTDEKPSDIKQKNPRNNNQKKTINPKKIAQDATGITSLKNKFLALELKIKIALILCAIFGGLLILLIIVMSLIMSIDTFTSSISTFFGIPEGDSEENLSVSEADGLYTNEEYYYDENGNVLNSEDLVNNLKNNSNCKITIWDTIKYTLNGSKFSDPCEFMRYIEKNTTVDKLQTNTDKGLIIGTIFYGFDSQPLASQYDNPKDAINNVSASNHFETLQKILTENDFIDEDELQNIINSTVLDGRYKYYTWVVDDGDNEEEEDSENGETTESNKPVTKKIGRCEEKDGGGFEYSLNKWKIFMRFGEEAALKYEEVNKYPLAYYSSDEECNGSVSDEELLERVRGVAGNDAIISLDKDSIETARNTLNKEPTYTDAFNQSADIDSKTKDNFNSFEGFEFDYQKGYAYTHFPYFSTMSNTSDGIDIEYDEVFTPKEIETIILEIIDRKKELNEVLLFEDMDNNLNFDNLTGVITGVSCGNYLSVKNIDEIMVRLTDCHGNFLTNVPFSDYIVGVANGEASNDSDERLLVQMVAAISFALHSSNNYSKGNVINMRSGTCAQAYCSMMVGCTSVPAPDICPSCASYLIGGTKAYPGLYSKYKALYEIASDYLIVSNGSIHNIHYNGLLQKEWKDKALTGMSFTQILQETYGPQGAQLVRCSEVDEKSEETSTPSASKVGNKATSSYPEVAPDFGIYYGFSYNDEPEGRDITINPEWKNANITTINSNCSQAGWNQNFEINVKAKDKFQNAFKKICTILTDGVKIKNGKVCKFTPGHLLDGGTFVERKTSSGYFSSHAYGLAIDFNYTASYNINGKNYSPYDSSRSLENYMSFVDAIGGEENCQNINYILWKYAFEPSGFKWGGNFGRNGNDGFRS